MSNRIAAAAAFCAVLLAGARPAHASGPLVIDDARVVGRDRAQLETWVLVDRQVVEHTALVAYGPAEWLELTAGLIHGGVYAGAERGYSITGPILQAKALLAPPRDNGLPGIALAAGVLPPLGRGAFKPPGWSGFAYAALTESLFEERLMLHANLGLAAGADRKPGDPLDRLHRQLTGGFGVQLRVVGGLRLVGEVYYGDPFDARADFPAMQAGLSYEVNDILQIDGTFGSTLGGSSAAGGHTPTDQWGTLGIRLVTPEVW